MERTEIHRAKISEQLVCLLDRNNAFKVFYHGQVQTLETYEPTNFLVDRDMVLYSDQFGNIKFFQNGQTYETNTTMPNEYWTGEGFGVLYFAAKKI